MNQFSQVQYSGLETFVSNLNDLYIELLINDALRAQEKIQYNEKIDEALLNRDEQSFHYYTSCLLQLEEL